MNAFRLYFGLGLLGIFTFFSITNYNTKEKKPIVFLKGNQYDKEWKKVDSLESNGLPKSALEVVNIIYESSKIENNNQQYIKSLFYIMKYKNSSEDDSYVNLIKDLKIEISKAKFPADAILNSVAAEMYWNYYINNRWKFYNRTNTVNINNDDLKTWSLDKISSEVISHYNLSLKNTDSLQRVSLYDFSVLITKGTKPENLRPTLYDFLAYRALDFFSNPEVSLTQPADKFELKEAFYFSEINNFIDNNIITNDTHSVHYNSIILYKELLRFRLIEQNNFDALIDANIHRLDFVYKNSVNDLKDSLYLNALIKMQNEYNVHSYSTLIDFKIAEFYNNNSKKYNTLYSETNKYKDYAIKAWNICNKVADSEINNEGFERCVFLKKQIELLNITFETENYIIPNENFATKISWKNINKIYYKIASIDKDKLLKIKEKYYNNEELFAQLYAESKLTYEGNFDLPTTNDYNNHSLELLLKPLLPGTYILFASSVPDFDYKKGNVAFDFINSTTISYSYRNRNGNYDFFVNHRKSGQALAGVTAELWLNKYNYTTRKYHWVSQGKYISNIDGYFEVKKSKDIENYSFYVEFKSGKDYLITDNSYYSYYYTENQKKQNTTFLFTDRAIYRPGQTIFFKGIVLEKDGDIRKILPGIKQTVTLYDVNYQKVSDIQLTTNEFGSFNGSFSIPTNLLNGQMQIHTAYGSKYISVEEYKRPKFEVVVSPLNGDYLLNQNIEIKGNAISYSGAGLSDADVAFRVVRKPMYRGWWYSMYNSSPTEIESGKVITDSKGEFKINFNAIPDLSYPKNENTIFNYEVVIDVTDINGETQSSTKNISVGYTALSVHFYIPDVVSNDYKELIEIATYNLNGEFIQAQGDIKIYKLKTPQQLLRKKLWTRSDKNIYTKDEWYKQNPETEYEDELNIETYEKEKLIKTIEFNTKNAKKIDLSKDIKSFPSGLYVAEVSSIDKFGNKVSSKSNFTVFSKQNLILPYKSYNWYHYENRTYEPGESAFIYIGSSAKNLKALFEIEQKGKIIFKEYIELNESLNKIEIPIKESYRGNISSHITFVVNNRFYTHSELITVPYTNKQMDIEFETFRNKLYPGENEQWILKLKGKNGEKVAAEMLATLYDASLDVFRKNYWSFDVWNSYYTSLQLYSDAFNSTSSISLGNYNYNLYYNSMYYNSLYYAYLNWFGFDYYSGYYYDNYRYSSSSGSKRSDAPSKALGLIDQTGDVAATEEFEVQEITSGETAKNGQSISDKKADSNTSSSNKDKDLENSDSRGATEEVKIRTNFNETAFFFPELSTNDKGEVIVKFTVPESLTKWKMMGMAHTKDLMVGFAQNELITQKDLMVLPNVPRFFRENDLIEFPVKISNISESKLNGTSKLEFFDAISLNPITDIFVDKNEIVGKSFSVEAGSNTLVSWKLKIPEGTQAITYRIVAKTNKFSDGEENVIPVMTNRMLVTETLPLPIRGKQTKEYTLDKLLKSGSSSTMRNHKLTLEFSSNPAWYAVQSLPYLIEYPYECAEQVFSRYYANSIASHIANSSPKIKKVFDSWKNTPNSEALLSNLEKNQELKSLLLQETPWVLNAQNETERKKRVGLLFDLNKMSNELESAVKKLQKMQVSNGGWPWFEGMPESRYITQHVVNGMGKLDKLGVKNIRVDRRIWNMVVNAVSYLDDRITDDYKWLKKYYSEEEMKQDKIGDIQIHYLYARSFFKDIPISNKNQVAIDYYKNQAEKYWLNKSKYLQGLIALSSFRNENKETPLKIAKSLKEYSLSSDEMGMYWKDNYAGYYWYQAPIEFQALMIELFDEVANDTQTVNDLKVWLLKQKQTTDWKTTKATVEAVYALLMRGTEWLENDDIVQITLGNIKLDPKNDETVKVEAGTGYFKKSWSASEIKPDMGKVKLEKNSDGVAWGGLYWQYFEQLDKITPHETPLKLNKKLFIEKNSSKGKILDPITEKNILKVGDKVIVRIELRVDRNMEYVHMKDMRASCFEPVNVVSRYKYQDGLGYYESTKDASTNFFFSYLQKGTYVFEYSLLVGHKGDFSNGITTIQCMYAPEFTSHSEGIRVKVQ